MRRLPPSPDALDRALLDMVQVVPPSAEAVRRAAADLAELLTRAQRHQVALLALVRLLEGPPDAISEDRRRLMGRQRKAWIGRILIQESELAVAGAILQRAGIRAVVLKGPALRRLAYESWGHRASFDLDLLVSRAEHPTAMAALRAEGFELSRQHAAGAHYHDVLRGPRGSVLELHWALSHPYGATHLDPESFLAHGLDAVDGSPLLWASPTDLLIHTASQALVGRFSSLHWVLDADRLVRRTGEQIDWLRVRRDGDSANLSPAVWQLLRLAGELAGTPWPGPARALAPGPLSRVGMASLSPGDSLLTGFAARFHFLEAWHALWLAQGWRQRKFALSHLLPARRIKPPALRTEGAGLSPLRRAAALVGLTVKVWAFQGLCLIRSFLRAAGRAGVSRVDRRRRIGTGPRSG